VVIKLRLRKMKIKLSEDWKETPCTYMKRESHRKPGTDEDGRIHAKRASGERH
jgi:hypothetical protein